MRVLASLISTVSEETIFTLLQALTGVDAAAEMERLAEEREASQVPLSYPNLPAEAADTVAGDNDESL